MQTPDKFTMETLTEGFLKGFVSSQITEVKKNLGITARLWLIIKYING